MMASRRRLRRVAQKKNEAACARKTRYPTKQDAERVLAWRYDTDEGVDGNTRPYLCPSCGEWHHGRPPGRLPYGG